MPTKFKVMGIGGGGSDPLFSVLMYVKGFFMLNKMLFTDLKNSK